jgi:hypothetical protein
VTEADEVGGEVRRIAILTMRRTPSACYLARRLRDAGAEIFLVSQRRRRVEPGSWAHLLRLRAKYGVPVFLDNLLLEAAKRAAALAARLLGALRGRRSAGDSGGAAAALREDPAILQETWLTHVEVDDVNRPPDQDRLRAIEPDLILLAGAPVLSRKTIEIARVACMNPHFGITPDFAGSSASDWAIFEGRCRDIGYTVHLVVPRVDSGPVLRQERVAWDPTRPNREIWPILAQGMYDALADLALDLVRGRRLRAVPQEPTRVLPPAGLVVRLLSELRRRRCAGRTGDGVSAKRGS